MKKNNNKKGFTIVELVIVIAVIAILAAVLIPTFSNVITKANNSADLQEARNTYTEYLAVVNAQPADVVYVKGGDQYFKVEDGEMNTTPMSATDFDALTSGVEVSMTDDNTVVVACIDGNHSFAANAAIGDKCTVVGCTGTKTAG